MRALALAVLVTSGCSFIQVRGTPRTPETPYETACASYQAPVADTIFAAAAVGAGAYLATSCDPEQEALGFNCLGDALGAGMLISTGVVLAASATYGYIQKARCDRRLPPGGAPYDPAAPRVSASSS